MRIWWCQEHGDNGNEERCGWQWVSEPDEPCRMVPMRLIPDNAVLGDEMDWCLEHGYPSGKSGCLTGWPFADCKRVRVLVSLALDTLALDGETP